MNGLDLIIRELQRATADLKADNDRAEAKQQPLPPRFTHCECGHVNEWRTVCWKCQRDLYPKVA